jgi:hypothetical protein
MLELAVATIWLLAKLLHLEALAVAEGILGVAVLTALLVLVLDFLVKALLAQTLTFQQLLLVALAAQAALVLAPVAVLLAVLTAVVVVGHQAMLAVTVA